MLTFKQLPLLASVVASINAQVINADVNGFSIGVGAISDPVDSEVSMKINIIVVS